MYNRYVDDDDGSTLQTRGDDLRNHLRRAAATVNKVQDPEAREALHEVLEAFRLVSEILYDLSDPLRRPVRPTADCPYSLS